MSKTVYLKSKTLFFISQKATYYLGSDEFFLSVTFNVRYVSFRFMHQVGGAGYNYVDVFTHQVRGCGNDHVWSFTHQVGGTGPGEGGDSVEVGRLLKNVQLQFSDGQNLLFERQLPRIQLQDLSISSQLFD